MAALVRALPVEATIHGVAAGHSVWSRTDELLAILAEQTNLVAYLVYQSVPTKHRKPAWTPLVIPRPGVSTPKPARITPAELFHMIGGPTDAN